MRLKRRSLPIQNVVCDINVTNLVDVTMVLLVVFILVAPMIENRIDISLPEVIHHDEDDPPEVIAISITSEKEIIWEKEKLPLERLIFKLRQAHGNDPKLSILLRADKNVEYGFVMNVLDRIKGAGIDAIDLATSLKVDK